MKFYADIRWPEPEHPEAFVGKSIALEARDLLEALNVLKGASASARRYTRSEIHVESISEKPTRGRTYSNLFEGK